MQWPRDAEPVGVDNVTLDNACSLLEALEDIHKAGVLHSDPFAGKLMVFPGEEMVYWIDFSSAQLNKKDEHFDELNDVAQMPFRLVSASLAALILIASGTRSKEKAKTTTNSYCPFYFTDFASVGGTVNGYRRSVEASVHENPPERLRKVTKFTMSGSG